MGEDIASISTGSVKQLNIIRQSAITSVGGREIVRRFDSKANIKKALKDGIIFDDTKAGISTTKTTVEPVGPDKIKDLTGAKNATAFIDIDVTGKEKIVTVTREGKLDIKIKETIKPSDIVDSGKVRKSKRSIIDNE